MSYIKHDAVIVTMSAYVADGDWRSSALTVPSMPDIPGFVASMPKHLRGLVVGPIPSVVNGYVTYVFAPDGGSEGWDESDETDVWREQFVRLFDFAYDDGSSPFNVVAVSWGGDEQYEGHGARIEYQHPTPTEED